MGISTNQQRFCFFWQVSKRLAIIERVVGDFYFWLFRNRGFLRTDLQLVRLRLSIALLFFSSTFFAQIWPSAGVGMYHQFLADRK